MAITVEVNERRQVARVASPLTQVLVVPKVELGATEAEDVTIPAPDNALTEITSSNEEDQLGSGTEARAMYDRIEERSVGRLFVLPFTVDRTDNADGPRLGRVVTALGALNRDAELVKLPHRSTDHIIVPRETARGTGQNPVIAALSAFGADSGLGAISLVDAGTGDRDQAAVTAWEAANTDPNIAAITNDADTPGLSGMPGAVLYGGYWGELSGRYGIHAQPGNVRDIVTGVSNISPARGFNPFDASSEALVLASAPIYVTSLVSWEGAAYFYGGLTQHADGSARRYLANNLVSHRIVKQARRLMVSFFGRRGSPRILDGLARLVTDSLAAAYVPTAAQSIEAHDPVIDLAGHVTLQVNVRFFGFIESVRLVVDVYI